MKTQGKGRNFVVPPGVPPRANEVHYEMAGQTRRAHRSWYRGDQTNYHPVRESLAEPDALARHVCHGLVPDHPFIDRKTPITAFGSCFAAEVTKYLDASGFNVFGRRLRLDAHVIRSGEGIVNSAALVQQFEWAFCAADVGPGQWHDPDGHELLVSSALREETRRIFLETEVFILTLGLSEVWYDLRTDEPFWRAIPMDRFDPQRHGFRLLGVEENRRNLDRTLALIRAHRPDATVIFTLSPVPLAATFRPVSCITANCVSKASLRMAIDEILRAHPDDRRLFYFPSYEIVTTAVPDALEDDLRHPRRSTVRSVMQAFHAAYLIDD